MKKRWLAALVLIPLILSDVACLKTRAQLREDSDDKPASAQPVQDVHPQGEYVLDEIKEQITQMEGRLEDLERNQKDLSGRLTPSNTEKEDMKKLVDRITQLEQSHADLVEEVKKLQESPALVDTNELFEKAMTQFKGNDYTHAAQSFGIYLKAPKIKKVEEATFLRGQCYYHLKDYKKAIVDFSKFPEKYTHSKHMSEALYKIALSFEALGMKDDAKGFYQELVEKYPKSPEAKKARKKIR